MAAPTRLFAPGADSSGLVSAQRWSPEGWISGDVTLDVTTGEVHASVGPDGRLTVTDLEIAVAPIDLPIDLFKQPAQLSDVRVRLTSAASGAASWAGDDHATARLTLALDLDWAIFIDGGKTPLGVQALPPIDVDFELGGNGDTVEATIRLAASGELWNWAGLLELTHLELAVAARSVD